MPPRRRRPPREPEAPKPPKPPDLWEFWQARYTRALEHRKTWITTYRVETGERYVLGDQDAGTVYNHLAATLRMSRPNLFFQTPKFFLRAQPKDREPVAERTAAIGEGVLESIARQDDHLEIAGNLAVFQAFTRIGVLKICYDPRMEPNPRAGEVVYQTKAGEPILNAETQAPTPEINPLTGEPVLEPEMVLTDEAWRWRWVDAANMLLPDAGPDCTVWPWIGEEVVVPLAEAKVDPRFAKDLRKQLVANVESRLGKERTPGRPAPMGRAPEDLLHYVECYDHRTKQWVVWADGQPFDGFLVNDPLPDWLDDDPYAVLALGDPILGPVPSAWPKPFIYDWLDPQREYNIRRQQINEGCKRSARKGIYKDGAFADEDEAIKFMQDPDDMKFAKGDPDKVKILDVPTLSADVWRDLAALQTDWRIITHQTGARQADPDKITATESTFMERAAGLVDSDQQKAVIRWMSQAGRKMFQAVKTTLTLSLWIALREFSDAEFQDYATRVYGLDPMMLKTLPGLKEAFKARFGAQKWQQVTRETLQFEADVTVVPGSARPRNLDSERRAWMELLKILGAAPQLALSRELLRYTAEKFDVTDERLLDELTALAEKMVQINSNQAGRTQGGGGAAPSNGTTAAPDILAAITGGMRG